SFYPSGSGLAGEAAAAAGGSGVCRADVARARFPERGAGEQRGESGGRLGELSRDCAPADDSRPGAYPGGGDLERDRRPPPLRLGGRPGELHRAGAEPVREWRGFASRRDHRSEEHTSELQSRFDLVCRLLLEKKKYTKSDL